MKKGDFIKLKRRHSNLNGWSIRPDLDGKIVKILEIEDRINGSITAEYQGSRLLFFKDAVENVVYSNEVN